MHVHFNFGRCWAYIVNADAITTVAAILTTAAAALTVTPDVLEPQNYMTPIPLLL